MLGIRREKDKLATAAETKKSALTFKSTPSLSDSDISSELSAQNADKRRNAIEFSEKELQEKITAFSVSTSSAASNIRSARFLSPKQIPENAPDFFDVIYLPVEQFTPSLASGIVLPVAIHDSEKKALLAQLEKCKELGAVHCLIGNIGHISDVAKMGFVMHGDFRLNITNSLGFGFYNQLAKFEDIILSPELILAQARDIKQNKSVIVYGKLPLMTLERRCGSPKLVDRRNTSFSVIAENNISGMRQREIVYNGFTIWMADKADALKKAKINNSHFFFTNETQAECYDVIERYKNGLMPRDSVHIRRIK